MKRVLMVSPRYLPIIGGAEVQCSRLVDNLTSNFNEEIKVIGLVTRRVEKSMPKYDVINGLSVVRIKPGGISRASEYLFAINLFFYLIFNRKRYDVIHCHATGIFGIICSLVSKIKNKKAVLKISTNDELSNLSSSQIKSKIAAYAMSSSVLVALNRQAEKSIKKYFPDINYKVIANGIDNKSIFIDYNKSNFIKSKLIEKYGNNVKICIYVGRYVERKGIDIIESLSTSDFLEKNNLVVLLIGGNNLQRDGVTLNIKNERVIDHGLTNDVFTYLDSADIFISPSRLEGLPNTVIEALSMRLPCVLSNIEPHSEINELHQKETLLFELDDIQSFKNAILELVNNLPCNAVLNDTYSMYNVAKLYRDLYMESDNAS